MSRWYRAYEGTVTDPKIGEAALVAETSRSVAIATWHAVLESAASGQQGGKFDTTPRRVAAALGEPLAVITALFVAFDEIGLTHDGAVTAWSRRQYESDSSATRTQAWRDRKKTSCDGPVTATERHATPPDTETDTEAKAEQKKETRKGSALPADWTPLEGHFEKAQAKGFSRQFVSDQADAMREWANANRNRAVARKADWNLTFDGWLRREMEKPRPKDDTARTVAPMGAPRHGQRNERGQVYTMPETPQGEAWRAEYMRTRGRGPPSDKHGGWWFDSEFPLSQEHLEAAE
jgi:hypothetical protein